MRTILRKSDYIDGIVKNLRDAKYDENTIQERVKHIKCEDIDKVFNSRGYKYLINFYMEVDKNLITFFDLGSYTYAMTVDNGNGTYNVTFAFLHPMDAVRGYVYSDFKKHLVRNYYLNKYRFDNVKSVTKINAVCIAVNNNSRKFPSWHRGAKIQPVLTFKGNLKVAPVATKTPDGVVETYPSCLVKPGKAFNAIKKELNETYGVVANNVRYYNGCDFMKIMAVKKNGFQVTFSFVTPVDRYLMCKYCHNDSVRDMVDKTMLMNNFKNAKYTYAVPDGVSSMESIVRAFNTNHYQFPNWAKRVVLGICFDWNHKNPKYNRI